MWLNVWRPRPVVNPLVEYLRGGQHGLCDQPTLADQSHGWRASAGPDLGHEPVHALTAPSVVPRSMVSPTWRRRVPAMAYSRAERTASPARSLSKLSSSLRSRVVCDTFTLVHQ